MKYFLLCLSLGVAYACEPITNTSIFKVPEDLGYHPSNLQETWWYTFNFDDNYGNHIGLVIGVMKASLQCKADVDEIFSLVVILVNATSQERHAGTLRMLHNQTNLMADPYRADFGPWHIDDTSLVGKLNQAFEIQLKFDKHSEDWFYYGPSGRAVLCPDDCMSLGITYPSIRTTGTIVMKDRTRLSLSGHALFDRAYANIKVEMRPWTWVAFRTPTFSIWFWYFNTTFSYGGMYHFATRTKYELNHSSCSLTHVHPGSRR